MYDEWQHCNMWQEMNKITFILSKHVWRVALCDKMAQRRSEDWCRWWCCCCCRLSGRVMMIMPTDDGVCKWVSLLTHHKRERTGDNYPASLQYCAPTNGVKSSGFALHAVGGWCVISIGFDGMFFIWRCAGLIVDRRRYSNPLSSRRFWMVSLGTS